MRRQNGIALVVVLSGIFCLFLFFLAFQMFSQSQFRHLDRIVNHLTLDHLVRAGLNVAEDKLQKGRWYGGVSVRGRHELSGLPVPGARVVIYADDYCQKDLKRIGSFSYVMLDHVKVFVEATLRNHKMYGYGKYVISPEPIMGNALTRGNDISYAGIGPCPLTFRKFINVRLLREVEIVTRVPGFIDLADLKSRRALAEVLKEDLHGFAIRHARSAAMAERLRRDLVIPQPALSQTALHQLLLGFDPAAPPLTASQAKNLFILDGIAHFPMDVNWDGSESEKQQALQEVRLELGPVPPKTADPQLELAVRTVFGEGHPKKLEEGRDFWPTVPADGNGSAVENYLRQRGMTTPPDVAPRRMQEDLSRVATRVGYSFQWRAVNTRSTGAGGTASAAPWIIDGGPDAFNHYWAHQTDPSVFLPGGKVEVGSKLGPQFAFTNYVLVRGTRRLPLAFVINVFLKYVDESAVYAPDDPKDAAWWMVPVPPPGPGGETIKEWGDIGGEH